MGNDFQERANYISKLRAMGFNYKFEKYETKQLKNIYLKSMQARNKICKEISELGTSIGKRYDMNSLYYSGMNIDELRGLKSRLKEENRRLMIVNQIMELADFLGHSRSKNFVLENMFLGNKSTEDLEQVLEGLQRELHKLEEKDKEYKETINYDVSYAIGDDPIFDNVEKIVTIPKDKMAEMVKTLDTLHRRRKKRSNMLSRVPRKKYMRIMAKYHDLDTNYSSLTPVDHEWLLNFYNNAVTSLDDEFQEIAGEAYTKHI